MNKYPLAQNTFTTFACSIINNIEFTYLLIKAFKNSLKNFYLFKLFQTQKMSLHILSDPKNVWERTIVYQTFQENFVVFIQQKRTNEKEENWTTLEHFMIPEIFINFIAFLPDKKESDDCGGTFIPSSGFVPPLSLTYCR